jgi:2,4-dienoyl-CoA reductase-like NADH-dependent reductase (Old Yellow Enzyme family)
MSRLFEPLRIGTLTLTNRIVVAPMCQYSATDGVASDWHLIHLGTLAMSGAALLVLEATAVSPEARISPRDLGLYDEASEAGLARVLQAIRAYSPIRIAVQLAHAGRKASTRPPWEGGGQLPPGEAGGWQTLGASALPYNRAELPPDELDEAGIARVRAQFAAAAQRAARLGFDGIEIHAAHGYLLHQFLSPIANRRHDGYGGSLANRMRLTLEVYDVVRAAFTAERPVWVRLSATDWVEGGWDIDSTLALTEALQRRGCVAVHVTSGGISPAQSIRTSPGYQVPYSRRIKAKTGLTTIAVGLITAPELAESIIANREADAVSLARALLYDPRWPWHAAARLGARVWAPPQYWRCRPAGHEQLFLPGELTAQNLPPPQLP